MPAYYNEIDPFAAQWLRNLISHGLIAAGDVDERSIEHVAASDLDGYTQCHFFAGIGGWSHALRLAGVSDNTPVWTGSCPCQPLSGAGRRQGHADSRHLWPDFWRLIDQCRPATIFGEQVASIDGREWLAAVRADLETLGYAVGAADLCAAGVGAPHIRQRLYWLAHANSTGRDARQPTASPNRHGGAAGSGSSPDGLGDAGRQGLQDSQPEAVFGERRREIGRATEQSGLSPIGRFTRPSPTDGFWSASDWLHCRDARWRPVEPSTFPLADGISARVGRLRAYGNAIVPQVAAQMIRASFDFLTERGG